MYGDELSELILLAKEKHNSAARNFLAELLVESFMRAGTDFGSSVSLVPIPSSKRSNRSRGYRHAYLLTRELMKRLPLHQRRSFTVNELLTVNRKIGDQTNLNREERERNVQGAYSVAHSTTNWAQILEGREVLLVDDVVTTGSSVREGIRTLRQAGIWPLGVLAAGVSPRLFS
jgi:ComF family protein